ncbi:response regulator transcription factor [Ginsengibacter hankyongi]|uniref:Response regulator transcription factor n=1 Tax=Ginsengibacter hankyongi TaxID=2607284 RepID=A0A5J5IFI2_9BACT|nr:response regulator transcription factor [Ginsengibacter hankyongi]KAA9035533.1 response regulator transcription factor [Ginsengibacter hankyongi]
MQHILLVDDHPIITDSLKIVIENSIAHCKTDVANDGDAAFEKIKHNDYDLIIMDVSLPNTDSYSMVSNILAIKPASRILMFSMNSEEIFAKRYLKMGAMGFLRKDAPLDEIKNAIETALKNNRYMSQELRENLLMDVLDHNKRENQFDKLSPREFEIVQHLVHGESVSEISKKLNLHTSTIGTHKARIFEKLRCDNIVELVTMAKVHHIL